MNAAFLIKKTPIVFLVLLGFLASFSFVEAKTSIRLRRVKTQLIPRHITLSARSGNGIYARKYAYGRPISGYETKGNIRRYYNGRNGNRRRGNISRNYASRYRNWTPNRNFYGGRNNPRADKVGHLKKRKELYPFLTEPPRGTNKQKRRVRPNRLNAMQRPKPPKKINEFNEDYFFPEEAKRAETKYEYESRYPRPKKKRRPEFEQSYGKPEFSSKVPFYDDSPLPYKIKSRRPSFSYSSFVQHPSGLTDDPEEFYEDPDNQYVKPVVRNKKKKVKKKSNSKKKIREEFKPFVFENEPAEESYPPYLSNSDYELPTKSYRKRNKPTYDATSDDDDDGDEFHPSKTSSPTKSRPQVSSFFGADSDFRGSQNSQQTSQFSPSYAQTWSQASVVQSTSTPAQHQTENGFQPQYNPNQYSYNKDYSSLQKTKTVTTNTQHSTYYSPPNNGFKNSLQNNYVTDQVSSTRFQAPSNLNAYSGQQTYSQPVLSGSSVLTDVTIQKSVPIYDNTETFYNFNNNAYVNGQSSKHFDPDGRQSYGSRSTTPFRNKVGEKTDSDSDFIKAHQNLYNNGLSGVPVQGDGFAKETAKKDFDIGYGDFQFDENPSR